ncbi:MAG: hypothetical protein AB7D06_01535 [Pedobacter sp.]
MVPVQARRRRLSQTLGSLIIMIPDHIPVIDISYHYGANKNKDYREKCLQIGTAIITVFSEFEFIENNQVAISRQKESPESFKLTFGELSDTGHQFCIEHLDKWLSSLDRLKDRSESNYIKTLRNRALKFKKSA